MRRSIIWLPVRKLTVCAKVQLKEGQREGGGLIKSLFLSPLKGHRKGGVSGTVLSGLFYLLHCVVG